MRAQVALILIASMAFQGAFAQPVPTTNVDLFRSLKTDVAITVTKHATGADMVEITAESPDYTEAELRTQAEAIGIALNVPDRGLNTFQVDSGAPTKSLFWKATFATNGILAGADGIRLQAIVRAFAGTQYPVQIHGIQIGLPDAKPTESTLPSFDSSSVSLVGHTSPNPGIEYRVLLKTQDPAKIEIPDRLPAKAPDKAMPPVATGAPIWLIWILTIVGAVAAGALVYNLALRGPTRTPRR